MKQNGALALLKIYNYDEAAASMLPHHDVHCGTPKHSMLTRSMLLPAAQVLAMCHQYNLLGNMQSLSSKTPAILALIKVLEEERAHQEPAATVSAGLTRAATS
jgi:glycyl-tRNA synthetase alpha subunit